MDPYLAYHIEVDDLNCIRFVGWATKNMRQRGNLFGECLIADGIAKVTGANLQIATVAVQTNQGSFGSIIHAALVAESLECWTYLWKV